MAKLNGMFLVTYTVLGLVLLVLGFTLAAHPQNVFGAKWTEEELALGAELLRIMSVNAALSFPISVVRVQCQYQRAVSVFEAGGHGQVGAEPHDLHPAAAVGVSLAGHRYPESDADHRQRRGGGLLLSHPSADAHQLPWLRLRPHEEHDGLTFYVFIAVVVDQVNYGIGT